MFKECRYYQILCFIITITGAILCGYGLGHNIQQYVEFGLTICLSGMIITTSLEYSIINYKLGKIKGELKK